MGFSVNFPSVNKANQVEYVLPDNTTSTVEEALNNLYINGASGSTGTQSDILLGQLFFSSHNTPKPGLCYAGQTYSWSDNPKLKELFDSQGHDFIVDNLDGNFTVVNHTDFIRAGVSNIGTFVEDSLKAHTHTYQTKPAHFGEVNNGSNYFRGDGGRNNTLLNRTTGSTGGTETAPKHRTAYFGVYGDLAVVLLNTTSVEVLDEDDFASDSANGVSTQQATKAFITAQLSNVEGLRGSPVDTIEDLKALQAKDYEIRRVLSNNRDYIFRLGAISNGANGDESDNQGSGAWIRERLPFSIKEFDDLTDLDNAEVQDGEIIKILISPDQNHLDVKLYTIATESYSGADYEFQTADGNTLYAKPVGNYNWIQELEDSGDGVNNVYASYDDFFTGEHDLHLGYETYKIRRKPGATNPYIIRNVQGGDITIPSDDFDWYEFQRLDIYTIKFLGKPYTGSSIEILDEDDFASNSNTAIPTQQSVKAYVDALSNFTVDFIDTEASTLPNLSTTSAGGSPGAIVIGDGADLFNNNSQGAVLIGEGATIDSGAAFGVGIGSEVTATLGGVAIGWRAKTRSSLGVAIGAKAIAVNSESIQIGKGTNASAKTLQVYNIPIVNAQGLITSYSPSNYSPIDIDNVDSHFEAIDAALANVGANDYFKANSVGTFPIATAQDSIAIGPSTQANSSNSIVIGQNSSVNSTSNQCISIGRNITISGSGGTKIAIGDGHSINGYNGIAVGGFNSITAPEGVGIGVEADVSAFKAIQLGKGINSNEETLQFLDNTLANNQGLYTPFANPTNYAPTITNNVTSHFRAIDTALANAGASFYRTNRENISVSKQLVSTDPNLQLLKNESSGAVTVNLPTVPAKDDYFLIASRKDSVGPINVNTITLYPGDRLELIYDGTEWFPL